MRKLRKLSRGKEKKRSWIQFSKYIRLRDCLRTTGDPGWGQCITCRKLTPYKEAHAGHFISRGCEATLFDERNVTLQCAGCNTYRNGEQAKYLVALEDLYGREVVDELMDLKQRWDSGEKFLSTGDIREVGIKYKEKFRELI